MSSNFVHDKAISANSESPNLKFRGINIGDCRWTEGFWADKYRLCEEVMVPHMGELLKGEVGHAYNNFKIAAGLAEGEAKGMLWHDGDFFKWMEAAVYVYSQNKDQKILDDLDEIISVVAKAQQEDGYLHTHVQINGTERWRTVTDHELYNCGHLIQGAVIHHRVTGKTNWLDLAVKNADYLFNVFSPREERLARFGFNPSQIMALVELYRTTKNKKYLELADIFVTMRGSVPLGLHDTVPYWFTGDQCQMKTPLREEVEAVGHAVTGMYLWSGAADVFAETGDQQIIDALDRIWDSATNHKMYLTGALGQCHHGAYDDQNMVHEGFIDDYMMPNSTAYNETCANIANAMFNWRLNSIKGESKYADIMETVIYNSALVGISDDGKKYFYANPLRFNHGQREYSDHADCTESADREPYIECFCCPPNLVRTIAQLNNWAYSLADDGVVVNLYGGNELNTTMLDGSALTLTQHSDYPWQGDVRIEMGECKEDAFALYCRIPGWVSGATARVNGVEVEDTVQAGAYLVIRREWREGDVVELNFPMTVDWIEGHPRIEETRNQVALRRGPVVYAIETPDLPQDAGILDVYLPASTQFEVCTNDALWGGVTVLKGDAVVRKDKAEGMYRKLNAPEYQTFDAQFVPYFSWSNRGTAEMTVFLPVLWGQ